MKNVIKIFILFNGIIGILFSSLGMLAFYKESLIGKIVEIGRRILISYALSSVFFWFFMNRYFLLKSNLLREIIPFLPFLAVIFSYIHENLPFLLLLPFNLYIKNFFFILLSSPSYLFLLFLLLYFIGTEIVPTPKMVRSPVVKMILLAGLLLEIFGKDLLLFLDILVLSLMTPLTIRRFYGQKMHSLLIPLMSSIPLIISHILGMSEGIFIANLAGLLFGSNLVFLFLLQDRGWILLKGNISEILKVMYFGVLVEIFLSITASRYLILLLSLIVIYLYLRSLRLIQEI